MKKLLTTVFLLCFAIVANAAWIPISRHVPQYMDSSGDPYSGAVLKFYADGTTSVIALATDNTGSTQATSALLNASGYPTVSGNVIIPHIDQDYKLALYPTQAAADSDTGAIWTIDNLSPAVDSISGLDLNGTELILDTDGDTSITADTDDQIDIKISGADDFTFTANTFTGASGSIVIADTIEPSGDTSSGDNAAIGYTATEGLILTGQGSTNDITVKNDADDTVFRIPTGGTNVFFDGNVTITKEANPSITVWDTTNHTTGYFVAQDSWVMLSSTSNVPLILQSNAQDAVHIDASQNVTLKANFLIENSTTPASASATCTTGTIEWDTSYVYVCTATDTWKRAAISTW